MKNGTPPQNLVYNLLGILLVLVAINAFGGGFYGMAGAKGIPLQWLQGSIFKTYFIPSLALFIGIGGGALIAAILVFKHKRAARFASLTCAAIMLVWLVVQVGIIGYVSWLQPATAIAASAILILGLQLKRKL